MSVYKVLKHAFSVARQERRPNRLTLDKMLLNSFDSYFTKLDSIHSYTTRQITQMNFFTILPELKWGKRDFIMSA